uniref:Hint domain-containing protein n=1 Tax=Parascaris equorum TaxID=6256 RepID=A0A914S0V3_PAREQ
MGIWLVYTAGLIASVVAYITQDGKPHIPTMTSPETAKAGSSIGLNATNSVKELNSLKPVWKSLAARRTGYYKPSIEDYDDDEMEQQPMRREISRRPKYGTSEYFWPFQSAMKAPYRTLNSNRHIPVDELWIDSKTDDNIKLGYYDALFDGDTGGTKALASHPSQTTAAQDGNADSSQTTNGIEQSHPVYAQLSTPAPHINKYLQVATPALPLLTKQNAAVQRAAPLFSYPASEYYYGSSGNLNGVFDSLQCFSGDMTVETPDGTREIRSLKTGDKVLSIEGSFISYSPVIMFLHRLENETAEFNLITTEGNLQLKMTDFHLIYVTNCTDDETLRLTHSRNLRDIIVNSLLSSCHSNAILQTLQQTFFTQWRRLSSWLRAEDDSNEQNGELPLGVAYLTSILDALLPIETFI